MDVNNLIDEIFDLLEDASSVPLSRKVMVDPDEIYEILNEIREGLPQEIRKSQEIVNSENDILTRAKQKADEIQAAAERDAERIRTEAQNRLNEMINEHDITQGAKNFARDIELKAEQNARTLSLQATTYIDDMFANAQGKLNELLNILDESRAELRNQK